MGSALAEPKGPRPAARKLALAGTILVVGLGSVGLRHLRNLRALGQTELAAHHTGLGTLPADDAHVPVYTDLASALAARPVAVVVANPTALHLPTALAAARAGAHVFIEKPLSHAALDVSALRTEVERRNLVAQVGFQFRYHPTLRRVKAWLLDGAIGRVVSAHAQWSQWLGAWHPWEDYRRSYSARRSLGGGVIHTLCHPFDYLRWLLGEVDFVSAQAGGMGGLELDVEDTAVVTLGLRSGALASIYLDYVGRPPVHRLEIVGRDGRICWDGESGVARLFPGRDGSRSAAVRPPAGYDRNQMFVAEMRRFLERIRIADADPESLVDGIRALEIALASHRSAETAERVFL